jgi:hypothetical protein
MNSINHRRNHRKEDFSHQMPKLNFSELLRYSATKKFKSDDNWIKFSKNNPLFGRGSAILEYWDNNILTILPTIIEKGYFLLLLPLPFQDKKGATTKKVFFCFCNDCLTYFVRFDRRANTCLACKTFSRKQKLIEQQKIRRTVAKNLTPRYCEHCGELLPGQKKRKNKKYCNQSCQQAAYYRRKKVKDSS